jgi:hypothetical protein
MSIDVIIVGDLMKAPDAFLVVERQRVPDFYQQTLPGPQTGSAVAGEPLDGRHRPHRVGRFRHLPLEATPAGRPARLALRRNEPAPGQVYLRRIPICAPGERAIPAADRALRWMTCGANSWPFLMSK